MGLRRGGWVGGLIGGRCPGRAIQFVLPSFCLVCLVGLSDAQCSMHHVSCTMHSCMHHASIHALIPLQAAGQSCHHRRHHQRGKRQQPIKLRGLFAAVMIGTATSKIDSIGTCSSLTFLRSHISAALCVACSAPSPSTGSCSLLEFCTAFKLSLQILSEPWTCCRPVRCVHIPDRLLCPR